MALNQATLHWAFLYLHYLNEARWWQPQSVCVRKMVCLIFLMVVKKIFLYFNVPERPSADLRFFILTNHSPSSTNHHIPFYKSIRFVKEKKIITIILHRKEKSCQNHIEPYLTSASIPLHWSIDYSQDRIIEMMVCNNLLKWINWILSWLNYT